MKGACDLPLDCWCKGGAGVGGRSRAENGSRACEGGSAVTSEAHDSLDCCCGKRSIVGDVNRKGYRGCPVVERRAREGRG